MDADPIEESAAESAPAELLDTDSGAPAPPQPPAPTVAEAAPVDATTEPPTGGAPPRRGLKLVVSLWPGNAMGYRALLALGSDGCDPLLRAADVADLAGALEEVPGLLAEAEGRWQLQPRYPATAPPKPRAAGGSRAPSPPQGSPRRAPLAASIEPQRAPAPSAPRAPAPPIGATPASSPADQLTLFG